MDNNNTEKNIDEIFKNIPNSIQQLLLDDAWRNIIKEECDKYNLSSEVWVEVENSMFLIITESKPINDLPDLLLKAGVPENALADMITTFDKKILDPVRQLVEIELQEQKKAKEPDPVPKHLATKTVNEPLDRDEILKAIQGDEGDEDEEESLLFKTIKEQESTRQAPATPKPQVVVPQTPKTTSNLGSFNTPSLSESNNTVQDNPIEVPQSNPTPQQPPTQAPAPEVEIRETPAPQQPQTYTPTQTPPPQTQPESQPQAPQQPPQRTFVEAPNNLPTAQKEETDTIPSKNYSVDPYREPIN